MNAIGEQARVFYELRFRNKFLEAKAAAFQDMFVAIMSKAHPGDFIPCRPWGNAGDRKNDGYLKSERTLFQVYAPNEMKMAETVAKVVADFSEALPYWQDHFDTWVFVHNAQAGLPPDVIAKLLELEQKNSPLKVKQWGFEELLFRFQLLSSEALCSLYGSVPSDADTKKVSEARRKLKLSQELMRGAEHSEAIKEMTEALAVARADGNEEEEVEILMALALSSSEGRGQGNRQLYFQQAEKLVDKIKTSAVKVIYFRARAAALEEKWDLAGAEEAYRAALHCCSAEPEDEKGNLSTQGCVVRSSFVHFLCDQKKIEEARPLLAECEDYARQNKHAEEGELLQAALMAGIHYSLEVSDEPGAMQRITELEQVAATSGLANRVGGDLIQVANRASHRKVHSVALAAAEACVRIGQQHTDGPMGSFLLGALYTEAMVIMQAGDDETALSKAEALLDACHSPEAAPIKQATHHLIAEIRRCSGDSQSAVDLARLALSAADGRPEEIAFTKSALARALNDNGQTEEALKQAKEAWVLVRSSGVPAEAGLQFLSQITNYASQLGAEEDVADALAALEQLPDEPDEVKTEKSRARARASANRQLRERFLNVLHETEPAKAAGTETCVCLSEANAIVVQPLLRLWDEMPECFGGCYDFWGRGNFERMLFNTRSFPNSFNVTLEVRSLDDVKRAIRIWGLYADFLILLWKGATKNGVAMIPFPGDYTDPGGWGYMICAGDVLKKKGSKKKYYPAMTYISALPDEVAAFLAVEARPFIQSGHIVVVPAVGTGCINPGHGPFEQLLAEAANAIPSIRWKGIEGSPIGLIPYSPNAPLEVLAEVAESESDRLRKLRLLLLKRSRELEPHGAVGLQAKTLSLEIDDALRDLDDRNSAFSRKKGLERAKEPITGATARFASNGKRLASDIPNSPFAPLLVLENLGYGWQVDGGQIPKLPPRFEPQDGDAVGTWLAPPSRGWTIPTVAARVP